MKNKLKYLIIGVVFVSNTTAAELKNSEKIVQFASLKNEKQETIYKINKRPFERRNFSRKRASH